jgi:3-hydroxybutyryl-CoA dehydrogenase
LLEEDAILATNTSSIDLNEMGRVLKRPERLVGMHFFNPAPVMSLVEVVQSTETDSEVADLVFSLAEQWGKIPVHVRSSPGFIVNRAARPFYSEALAILKEGGTDAATCDAIMRECGGFRMGPFELMDLIGLDVNYSVTCQIWESYQRHPRFTPPVLQKELVDSRRLGRKSGQGFFEYGVDVEMQVPKKCSGISCSYFSHY